MKMLNVLRWLQHDTIIWVSLIFVSGARKAGPWGFRSDVFKCLHLDLSHSFSSSDRLFSLDRDLRRERHFSLKSRRFPCCENTTTNPPKVQSSGASSPRKSSEQEGSTLALSVSLPPGVFAFLRPRYVIIMAARVERPRKAMWRPHIKAQRRVCCVLFHQSARSESVRSTSCHGKQTDPGPDSSTAFTHPCVVLVFAERSHISS